MKRPEFTKEEERLIDHIRNHEASAKSVWFHYTPWIIGATILLALGLGLNQLFTAVIGFAAVLAMLLRFIFYQCKSGWRIKPLVDKYEDACTQSEVIK